MGDSRALDVGLLWDPVTTQPTARGMLFMLLALALFVFAVALLPFHMAPPERRKPEGRASVEEAFLDRPTAAVMEPDGMLRTPAPANAEPR